MEPRESGTAKCLTCYGQGETATEWGVSACPDCGGTGTLPPRDVLVEWRLRAIEKSYLPGDTDAARDVAWLAFELRRARHALVQILALSQESADHDGIAKRTRFLANDALGMYDPKEPSVALGPTARDD